MITDNAKGDSLQNVIVAKVVIRGSVSLKGFLRALSKSKVSKYLIKKVFVVSRNEAFHITLTVDPVAKKTLELTFKRGVLKPWSKNLKKTRTVTCGIPDTKRSSQP